ncbi:sensor histidine kinase [Parvicella tangerina]|uniref:histidine kinase n=1 Tax=Parvicella tangerina TaxID=2829795 RepID=A0A916JPJ3_9FLAO|nr:HAMP domain-containing sensor histidine kinase [Parvicella tangerina]CAG5085734.1 Adaptive-response sensory-kinase SasA [Parvicella tangerina]
MKAKNIRLIIFFSILAVLAMVVNQYFWVESSVDIQEKTISIQKKNAEMERSQFDNQVTLALVGVRDELISLNTEASGLYLEPVQQITENYFVVSFYDTLNPTVLQNLLVEKFAQYNITEPFEYGIYDCFTDSIIFDKYVDLSEGEVVSKESSAPQQKWNHDGHYFGVYFPDRVDVVIDEKDQLSSGLIWSTLLIGVILLVFAVSIFTILKQKRLSEVKTDFINNMTHELKTPISTIALSSDVLRKVDESTELDRIRQYASIIYAENARLESQVERVLQLAKLEKDKIQLKKEAIAIHGLIEKCMESFELVVKQKQGSIEMELDAKSDQVYGDKVHLSNVIHNLLDNATKYSKGMPEIKVRTYNKDGRLVIEFEDKGKGMSPDQTKQIFEKFYRVPTGSVHDVKGFGLGLYYVKEIVNAHQGKIEVESELGVGSTFRVILNQNT